MNSAAIMDVSKYMDYVLLMLFIKFVTHKHGDNTNFDPRVRELHCKRDIVGPGSTRGLSATCCGLMQACQVVTSPNSKTRNCFSP